MKSRRKAQTVSQALYKLPLVLEPQPEGGYTVTCPLLPELVTEGDTAAEALANVSDALTALLKAYRKLGRTPPPVLKQTDTHQPLWLEAVVAA
jgi:antitoxin HicB